MSSDKAAATPQPPSTLSSLPSFPTLFRLLAGLILVTQLPWPTHLPRIQPIRYPAAPGQDIVYGFRVSSSPEATKRWCFELGRLGDDGLRAGNSFMGMSGDNWLYLRTGEGKTTHVVLVSLFLANLITRDEAEAILGKGPGQTLSLGATIHRFPSFASLTAAYYAGSTVGTRKLFGPRASEGVALPTAVGGASAAGVALFSSRSTAFTGRHPPIGQKKSIESVMPEDDLSAAVAGGHERVDPFLRLLLLAREEEEEKTLDLRRVEVLPVKKCQELAAFGIPSSASTSLFFASTTNDEPVYLFDRTLQKLLKQRDAHAE
ncbi:hypothetical protein JCM8547_005717 [Rhodosporidiobolus lusitaniae]